MFENSVDYPDNTHLRPGTLEDIRATFDIFQDSLDDLGRRSGTMTISGGDDPSVLENLWEKRRTLWEHLSSTSSEFWVAEQHGRIVGYARAIQRDGVEELTDFFVKPDVQSKGIGKAMLEKVFPRANARYRTIIATLDERALARYLKTGVYGRFPIKYFSREPEPVDIESDLHIEPMTSTEAVLNAVDRIDQQVIAHHRRIDHNWIRSNRSGFTYHRDGVIVGYGYVGSSSGPFALLDERDYPAVLAHAEKTAHGMGVRFGVEAPLTNRTAIDYFMQRGYRIDAFTALFMSNEPIGKFENYIFFGPPLMM